MSIFLWIFGDISFMNLLISAQIIRQVKCRLFRPILMGYFWLSRNNAPVKASYHLLLISSLILKAFMRVSIHHFSSFDMLKRDKIWVCNKQWDEIKSGINVRLPVISTKVMIIIKLMIIYCKIVCCTLMSSCSLIATFLMKANQSDQAETFAIQRHWTSIRVLTHDQVNSWKTLKITEIYFDPNSC